MTSAATADRIVKGDCIACDDEMVGGMANMLANIATRDVPVIVADNVAAYVHQQPPGKYVIGNWPCLAPPWDWAWIEYPSSSGNERRGAWMLGFDLRSKDADAESLRELHTGMIGAVLEDAARQSPGEETRWALVGFMFIDDGRRVLGPVGSVIWALDEFGKELGNRWFLRPDLEWALAEEEAAMWLHAAITPALQTIAFMHCRNVVIDRHQRPPKLAKAYRRRHGREPLRWQTVRLELPRQAVEGDEATRPGTGPSLHIVTGHFSHYGDCCPTQHEPKGKLFGRLDGVYWMPMHLRGDAQHEVRSDRVVTLGGSS